MSRVFLLIGTELGIFVAQSGKERKKWELSGPYLGGFSIFCGIADLRNGAPVIYAGANSSHYGPMIFKSHDLGKNWKEARKNPRFSKEAKLSVEEIWQISTAESSGLLYAGVAPASLFSSSDSGKTWEEMKGLSRHETRPDWKPCKGGLCLHSILVHPEDETHLVVGISAAGIFETRDGGKSWRLSTKGLDPSVSSLCVHKLVMASDGKRIYQQNHLGVWRRDPGKEEWISIDKKLPSRYGFAIIPHPENPDSAYVIPHESQEMRFPPGGELAVYSTNDAGKAWKKLRKGLPSKAYVKVLREAFCSDKLKPFGLYFGTSTGYLFESLDEGESWFEIAEYLPKIYSVRAFAL